MTTQTEERLINADTPSEETATWEPDDDLPPPDGDSSSRDITFTIILWPFSQCPDTPLMK